MRIQNKIRGQIMYKSIQVDVSDDYKTKFQETINSFKTQ